MLVLLMAGSLSDMTPFSKVPLERGIETIRQTQGDTSVRWRLGAASAGMAWKWANLLFWAEKC